MPTALPVIKAPLRTRSYEGCRSRRNFFVIVRDRRIGLIVSRCQIPFFKRNLDTKIEELLRQRSSPRQLQHRLQSWIDGQSPCDQIYSAKEDVNPDATEGEEMIYEEEGEERTIGEVFADFVHCLVHSLKESRIRRRHPRR